MDNIDILKNILLTDDAREEFYDVCRQNANFKYWLAKILPELETCKMPQNNPWHIYNVLDHILYSVEAINKLSRFLPEKERLTLAMTMFLHDIGKPQCHLQRIKNGKMIDSFFHHNEASARIAHRVLSQLGFNAVETRKIESLVLKHDIFMFIEEGKTANPHHETLSKSLMIREMAFFEDRGLDGINCMQQLLYVGEADNLAQNPKMTKSSLHLIHSMQDMLNVLRDESERG